MNRKMKKLSISLCIACLTGILAAGCTEETDSDKRLPDGKYPMTFTAAVDGLTVTRTTTENSWEGGEEVAVQIGNTVKKYIVSADKKTLSSSDPFYWEKSDESKNVTAWHYGHGSIASGGINANAVPTSWSVKENQNEEEGYQKSDFLYAAPKSIKFSDTDKSLAFTHQTARVMINIKKAEAATETSSITKVTIGYDNNLALSGTYRAPTEGNATTGTWNPSGSTMGTITPKDITAAGDGSDVLKTYAALVIPQNMSGKKFIAVTLKDNNTYYYTPKDTDADLKSGTQYTYNITVKHGYLEVVTLEDGAWVNGTTTPVTSAQTFTEDDLKIGDYYYSDGKTSDGGLRKIYADGSTEVEDINPVLTDGRTCIGIVYWVGDITGDNYGLLNSKFPNGTHGLVVSLWDMPDPDNPNEGTMTWTYGGYEYVDDWLGKATWTGGTSRPSDFSSIAVTDKMQGYANTIALKEYNNYVENGSEDGYGKDGIKRVKPVKGLDDFNKKHQAPSNSSGWYWPSVCELKYVCWGQDNVLGTAGRNMLDTQIGRASGDAFGSGGYWSSTEGSSYNRLAWYVYFYDGYVNDSGYKYRVAYRVRPLLAF